MSTVQEVPAVAAAAAPESEEVGSQPQPYRFTAEAFTRMVDADVFADEDRVELWDGIILTKMAKKHPHFVSGNKATYALIRVTPPGWFVGFENPVKIEQKRVPLPDIVIFRGEPDDYIERHPVAADVGLVVELADSSLRHDTTAKLAGYAAAGIPAYWVVDLVHNLVLVFERPVVAEGRYESAQTFAVGQDVPLRLDAVLVAQIPAANLLPVPR